MDCFSIENPFATLFLVDILVILRLIYDGDAKVNMLEIFKSGEQLPRQRY